PIREWIRYARVRDVWASGLRRQPAALVRGDERHTGGRGPEISEPARHAAAPFAGELSPHRQDGSVRPVQGGLLPRRRRNRLGPPRHDGGSERQEALVLGPAPAR